jgi:predicted RNA-binding protein (virulence factor B family)
VASARLNRWLEKQAPRYRRGQSVRLLISERTPMGLNALINESHVGLLYRDPSIAHLDPGDQLKGYIQQIRNDGKIDLTLNPDRGARVVSLSSQILDQLSCNDGFLPLTDKSSPELIRSHFGVSKKVFKQTLGNLFKERKIALEDNGIRILDS